MACQVLPLNRLGEGAQALDAPADKFRDWQEITNSIFCSRPLDGLKQQMEVWFYLQWESQPRGQHTRRRTRRNLHRAPPQRVGRAFALLTKTYHGSRVTGQVPYQDSTCPVCAAGSDGRRNTGLQFTRRSFEA